MSNSSAGASTGYGTNWAAIDASETLTLSGWVTSGRGIANSRISRNANVVRDALGITIVEGSLNILLRRPVLFAEETAIQMHFDKGRLRLDWPAKLNGIDVWINRWHAEPLHVVELLSATHLREHLSLADGDEIQLEVRKCDVRPVPTVGLLAWTLFWSGRKSWYYKRDSYFRRVHRWSREFGATQLGTEKNCGDLTMALSKALAKKIPGVRPFVNRMNSPAPYRFKRIPLDAGTNTSDRSFAQVRNLLNYTKTCDTTYSAKAFPAGYHTIEIGGRQLNGQRNPAERLKAVPVDFAGKTVLDIGCNQGGMLFEVPQVKWAVGVDYDPRMINAANRIKSLRQIDHMSFYVLDLEKEPLSLLEDLIPEPKVDIVFLLSVCNWIGNWRDVISYGARISNAMLFETTGPAKRQELQIDWLRKVYGDVRLIADRSDDDPGHKQRKLFYCSSAAL